MGRARWLLGLAALLALPAVALTLNRVVQPDTGWSIRLVAFTPYALVLYVACLLLVGGAVVGARAARRRAVAVPALLLVAGLALHAGWVAPGLTGHRPHAAGETFTVMNLNLLHGGADPQQVVRLLEQHDVEVLVLQEVTRAALASLEEDGLAKVLPHSAGKPGEDGSVEGTMAFASDRITDVGRMPTTFGSWAVTVQRPDGDLRLHAVHPVAPIDDARDWRHDYGVLAEVQRQDSADLMLGDFNATLDHRALRELPLRDAAEMTNQGWRPTWPDNGTVDVLGIPLPRLVGIDHVLLGQRMVAEDVETASVDGTDHRAMIVEVGAR